MRFLSNNSEAIHLKSKRLMQNSWAYKSPQQL